MRTKYIKLGDLILPTEIGFLIVEDEKAISKMIEIYLDDIGFNGNFYHADCLHEAKRYLAQNKIDFIITDKGLPDGSGDSLLKAIRNSEKSFNNVPLLVLTGNVDIEDQILSTKLGASSYLTKPFTIEQLRSSLVDSFKNQVLPTEENNHKLKKKIIQLEEEILSLKNQIGITTAS